MKLTKGTIWPQIGEGTTHEVRSLPGKVRRTDKGADNAPGLQDIFSLEERVGPTTPVVGIKTSCRQAPEH